MPICLRKLDVARCNGTVPGNCIGEGQPFGKEGYKCNECTCTDHTPVVKVKHVLDPDCDAGNDQTPFDEEILPAGSDEADVQFMLTFTYSCKSDGTFKNVASVTSAINAIDNGGYNPDENGPSITDQKIKLGKNLRFEFAGETYKTDDTYSDDGGGKSIDQAWNWLCKTSVTATAKSQTDLEALDCPT